jgi:hypothetical protein
MPIDHASFDGSLRPEVNWARDLKPPVCAVCRVFDHYCYDTAEGILIL